jgi:hypothetical protein
MVKMKGGIPITHEHYKDSNSVKWLPIKLIFSFEQFDNRHCQHNWPTKSREQHTQYILN